MKKLLLLFLLLAAGSLAAQNPLYDLIEEGIDTLGPWAKDPVRYEARVLYTEIDRQPDGEVRLTTHRWGSTSEWDHYFYPASTVKMPVAILALQRLNELGVEGLDASTLLFHDTGLAPASAPQTTASTDSTSRSGYPNVANYVRKIFLTSDNDAYNRLFEFLGPTYVNESLRKVGISGGRILHRVGISGFNEESHAWLNPVKFVDGSRVPYQIGERHDRWYDPLPQVIGQRRGEGFTTDEGVLVREPFNFTHKNYLSLQNLHDILLRVWIPEALPEKQRFHLSTADYDLLRTAMTRVPRESDYPRYEKPDNYVKFWIYGDQPEDTKISPTVRVRNKVGWAYGYLTDAAYVRDEKSGREFILVGTIHTNANRIFNDGKYEYEQTGLPFFGQLGRAVLHYERSKVGR